MERQYIIYAIYNTKNDDAYIGCTCKSIKARFSDHKYDSKTRKSKLYMEMNKIGHERFKIVELLSAVTTQIDARKTEGEFIEFFKPTLNSLVTGLHSRDDGTWDEKLYNKDYYLKNRDKIKAKVNNYRNENKDKIKLGKQKQYIKNKEKIREKAKINIMCECKSVVRKGEISRHRKTEKHKNLMLKLGL